MLSYSRPVERCKALLGTFVRLRVHGLAPERAHAAIDHAFAEIAAIHALMSFHEPASTVSLLNREAHARPVAIDARTYAVLIEAERMARDSGGAFDITMAPMLVNTGTLPRPDGRAPDPQADWQDVVLLPDQRVFFRRPLWLDLGGIAKGYAVDRAMAALAADAPTQAVVNAGGDLRVLGGRETIELAPHHSARTDIALAEIENGALASSCGAMTGTRGDPGVHVDRHGSGRHPQFVCVAAPNCIAADALTKVVMACGADASAILAKYDACALVHDAAFGWRRFGVSNNGL